MMLIVLQVDVQESIPRPHTRSETTMKSAINQREGVGGGSDSDIVKFEGKKGLRTVHSRPANIYMIYARLEVRG